MTGRTLEGKEIEEFNERIADVPLIFCNGMSISCADTEHGDALVIGMELLDDRCVMFALRPEAIDGMIEGLSGAKQVFKDKNNAN